VLAGRTPAERSRSFVDGSRIGDAQFRKQLADGGLAAVNASDDPMIAFARTVDRFSREMILGRSATVDEIESAADDKSPGAIRHAANATDARSQCESCRHTVHLHFIGYVPTFLVQLLHLTSTGTTRAAKGSDRQLQLLVGNMYNHISREAWPGPYCATVTQRTALSPSARPS